MDCRLLNFPNLYPIALLVGALIITFALLSPGLSGGFLFDDEVNIVRNEKLHIDNLDKQSLTEAMLSGSAGPLKRPISMISFGLNYYMAGLNPYAFKLVNISIHLANGIGIYLICLLTLRSARKLVLLPIDSRRANMIALITAFAWMAHPINLSASLYAVQRMNSLSALFTICGLITYLYVRPKLTENVKYLIPLFVGTVVFTTLGVLSKENAILLPVFMLAFEIFIFRFQAESRAIHLGIRLFYLLTVAIPFVGAIAYMAANPEWVTASYSIRNFTPSERVLTETRGLWFYITLILLPNQNALGIFHDDFDISHSLANPLTTLPATLGLAMLVVLAVVFRRKAPIAGLGISLFLIGHSMESSIFGLELIHEHRNYLPSMGILFAVVYYLFGIQWTSSKRYLQPTLTVLLLLLFSATTFMRAADWGNLGRMYLMEALHHPDSPRAQYQLGLTYLQAAESGPELAAKYQESARKQFVLATNLREHFTEGLFALIQMASRAGQSPDNAHVDELTHRLRHFPFNVNNLNWINVLTSCEPASECRPPNPVVQRILTASMENTSFYGRSKAEVFTMASKFSAEQLHDLEQALTYILAALEYAPGDPQYELHVATMYLLNNQRANAEIYLEKAIDDDKLGIHQARINELRKLVNPAS